MRYFVTQKESCWRSNLYITNEQAQNVFWTKGHSLYPQFTLRDMSGNELAIVQQKLTFGGLSFEIYINRKLFAFIKKKQFDFFRNVFIIDIPSSETLLAEGDYGYLKYKFFRDSKLIALTTRPRRSPLHNYEIDILEQSDDVLIIACTIAFYADQSDNSG